jgi:hypothetical protein
MVKLEIYNLPSIGYAVDKFRGLYAIPPGYEVSLHVDERLVSLFQSSLAHTPVGRDNSAISITGHAARQKDYPLQRLATQLLLEDELLPWLVKQKLITVTESGELLPTFNQYLFPTETLINKALTNLTSLAVDNLPKPFFIFTAYQKPASDQGINADAAKRIGLSETCSLEVIVKIVKRAFAGSDFDPVVVSMQYGDVKELYTEAERLRTAYDIEVETPKYWVDLNDGSFDSQAAVFSAAQKLWRTENIPSIELGIPSTIGHLARSVGGVNHHFYLQDSSIWDPKDVRKDTRVQWQEIADAFPDRSTVVTQPIPGDWLSIVEPAAERLRVFLDGIA